MELNEVAKGYEEIKIQYWLWLESFSIFWVILKHTRTGSLFVY